MIPSEVPNSIAIGVDKTIVNAEEVSPEISGKVNTIAVVNFMTEFGIQVIEMNLN